MLIRFSVKNFMSFDEMQEFTMIPGTPVTKTNHIYNDSKVKLLKFSAIFGANASGKSNLIVAMDFFKKIILRKNDMTPYSNKYNRNNIDNQNNNSYFEIEINLNHNYYAYGFEVLLSKNQVKSEWLYQIFPEGEDKLIFSRTNDQINVDEYYINQCPNLVVYINDAKRNDKTLFLSIMNTDKEYLYVDYPNIQIFNQIYLWIKDKFNCINGISLENNSFYFSTKSKIEKMCLLLQNFGLGINDFAIQLTDSKIINIISDDLKASLLSLKKAENYDNVLVVRRKREFYIIDWDQEYIVKTIKFSHGNKDIMYDFSEESDGTLRMLDFMEILITNDEKVYVIDEIDRCFHPQLTKYFIKTYLENVKGINTQLIVTTHETQLLNLDLLRRDEIWFIERDNNSNSTLYSLDTYSQRFDQKIDQAYFDGRFGAIPQFSKLFATIPGEEDEN